jgi:hypothetical protein
MGWFSRKEKDLGTLPPLSADGAWGVAQGEHDGGPLLVRYNEAARQWLGHRGLPIKLGFAIPLRTPQPGGLPTPDENAQLGDVEDLILREVESATIGVQAFIVTTGEMKELVFYIPTGVDIRALHERVMAAVTSHEVQCMAVEEPSWDSYKAFVP